MIPAKEIEGELWIKASDLYQACSAPVQEPVAWKDLTKEIKLLRERMKKEDPRLLALMEKCFDAGVISGKEQAQRTWVGLTDEEIDQGLLRSDYAFKTAEAWRAGVVFAMTKLKEKNCG